MLVRKLTQNTTQLIDDVLCTQFRVLVHVLIFDCCLKNSSFFVFQAVVGIVVCYSLAFHKHLGGKTAEIISIFRNRCINKGKEVTCNGVGVGTVRDLGSCR